MTHLYYIILYYIILYYIILHYIILHYIILYCIILYYVISYYITLYCTVLYYITLYYTILYYIILICTAVFYIKYAKPLYALPPSSLRAPFPSSLILSVGDADCVMIVAPSIHCILPVLPLLLDRHLSKCKIKSVIFMKDATFNHSVCVIYLRELEFISGIQKTTALIKNVKEI